MKKIEKKSIKWLQVLLIIFSINILSFFTYQLVLDIPFDVSSIIGFKGISLAIAIISCLGYFGFLAFSITFVSSNIVGLIYMFFIIITDKNNGWADLTSIAGLFVFMIIGTSLGIIAQIVWTLTKTKKR